MELQNIKDIILMDNEPSKSIITNTENNRNFIKANTIEMDAYELDNHHIIPVFAKDNEPVISHTEFINSVERIISHVFGFHSKPVICVSHPIKGRIPEARSKASKELLPHEKTLYYERMMFICEIPSITETINGNTLSLTVGGVKAFNQDNLYGRKGSDEHFKFFIGFKNQVCTNLCVSTDGYKADLKARSLEQLNDEIYHIVKSYNQDKHLSMMSNLSSSYLTESQFAHLVGKTKLYNYVDKRFKASLPKFLMNDSQVSTVARDYYQDDSFSREEDGTINLWKLYNLLTGANKSSYIDTFLDRSVNALDFTSNLHQIITQKKPSWFINQPKVE